MVFLVTLIMLINPFAALFSLFMVGVVDALLFGFMYAWGFGINGGTVFISFPTAEFPLSLSPPTPALFVQLCLWFSSSPRWGWR